MWTKIVAAVSSAQRCRIKIILLSCCFYWFKPRKVKKKKKKKLNCGILCNYVLLASVGNEGSKEPLAKQTQHSEVRIVRKNCVRGGLCWRCSWFRWSWSTLCHIESKQLIQVQASSVTVSNGKILIYKKIQSISEWHGKSLSWKMGSNSHLWQTEGFLQLGWLKGHQFLWD